jgi:hypothetical protein
MLPVQSNLRQDTKECYSISGVFRRLAVRSDDEDRRLAAVPSLDQFLKTESLAVLGETRTQGGKQQRKGSSHGTGKHRFPCQGQ